jgi:hypothetical protein
MGQAHIGFNSGKLWKLLSRDRLIFCQRLSPLFKIAWVSQLISTSPPREPDDVTAGLPATIQKNTSLLRKPILIHDLCQIHCGNCI